MAETNHHKMSKDLDTAISHVNLSISLFGASFLLTAMSIVLELLGGSEKFQLTIKWMLVIILIVMGLYVIYLAFRMRVQRDFGDYVSQG